MPEQLGAIKVRDMHDFTSFLTVGIDVIYSSILPLKTLNNGEVIFLVQLKLSTFPLTKKPLHLFTRYTTVPCGETFI